MKFDNLHHAWKQYKFQNSLERTNPEDILGILELEPSPETRKWQRILVHTIVYALFILCF